MPIIYKTWDKSVLMIYMSILKHNSYTFHLANYWNTTVFQQIIILRYTWSISIKLGYLQCMVYCTLDNAFKMMWMIFFAWSEIFTMHFPSVSFQNYTWKRLFTRRMFTISAGSVQQHNTEYDCHHQGHGTTENRLWTPRQSGKAIMYYNKTWWWNNVHDV